MCHKLATFVGLFLGHGFADVRKQHVVSKYRTVVVRERENLGAWSEKLKKIYAENEQHTADEDPLERFAVKKKKRKKGVNVSTEQQPRQKEMATATAANDEEVLARGSDANTSTEKSSTMPANSR